MLGKYNSFRTKIFLSVCRCSVMFSD